jgi:uncharacterized protein (TIGR00369 family)
MADPTWDASREPGEDAGGAALDNPFLAQLGIAQTAWRDGYAEFRLAIVPSLLNRHGVLQGGVLATLLDAACGYAGLFSGDAATPLHGVTLSLTLNYLAPGIGSTVVAKGFVERRGSRVYFARGEAWLDERVLISTAQGTFKYTRAPRNGTRKTAAEPRRTGVREA